MILKEEFKSQLELLREESENSLVLVEGKKDRIALEHFKIKNILTLDRPIYSVVENIVEKSKTCILLTDLDKEGNKLYKTLKDELQKKGIKVNSKFRTFLFKHATLKEIEGLKSYFSNLEINI